MLKMNMHVKMDGNPFIVDRISFFEMTADHFEKRGNDTFYATEGIELLRLEEFQILPIGKASIFAFIEAIAQSHGHNTNGTFGGLTIAVGLDQQDAHQIGCACNGREVTGSEVAQRLRARARALK
jgi:hypothetical protein